MNADPIQELVQIGADAVRQGLVLASGGNLSVRLPDGTVALTAQWQVAKGPGGDVVTTRRTDIREHISGQGYEAQVAAQSKALEQLSREIADAVANVVPR